jgi:hypothetical protein
MAKLKTYQTSLGFFDLAIAAPSMKAALEAWGADSNLFHQGTARESNDRHIIAATLAKPGVVLRRAVGSNGPFGEHAELPTDLGSGGRPAKGARKVESRKVKTTMRPVDQAAEQKAALAYEREQKQRQRQREREEVAALKKRELRQRAIDKAQEAFDAAEREHAETTATIQADREAVERRSQAEDSRWSAEKKRLQAALRRAGD